jgi:hypothetical protein
VGHGSGDDASGRMAQRWPSLMGKGQNSPRSGLPLLGGRAPGWRGQLSHHCCQEPYPPRRCLVDQATLCLGYFLRRLLSCVTARAVRIIGGDECDHLDDVVLLAIVGVGIY